MTCTPSRTQILYRFTSGALAMLIGVQAANAFAQASAPAAPTAASSTKEFVNDAAALKAQGNEALGALRPGDALESYRKAYALAPEPALHYNIGHALEALGDYPGALAEYEEFARVAPPELRARVPLLTELIAQVRARVTVVTFRCNVAGARVLVRNVAVGDTGRDGRLTRALPAGAAGFEVAADGYATQRRQAVFASGGETTFDVVLVTTSKAGVLRVTTTPIAGDVFVDDEEVGRAPIETTVPAGPHRISVRRVGMRETTTQAVVDVGDTKEITVDLEKTPAVYTRWWFWTSVGIVIAGGAVLGYAALKERSADTGTIPPGQVKPLELRF